jgi:hypothetical protein
MNGSLAAYREPARVDMSKPSALSDIRTPAAGMVVTIRVDGPRLCSHPVDWVDSGHNPRRGYCVQPGEHDASVVPHVCGTVQHYGPADPNVATIKLNAVAPLDPPSTPRTALDDARDAIDTQRQRAETAEQKIADMRIYAIEKMRDGTICREGTEEFLEHFGLDLPESEFDVTYNVRVSVNATDSDLAEENARELLDSLIGGRDDIRITHDWTDQK